MSDEDSGFKVRSQGRLITNPTGPALFKVDVNPGDPGVITVSDKANRVDFGPGRTTVNADHYDRMTSMLRRLEWAAIDHRDMEPRCPVCDARQKDGHYVDPEPCEFDALLRELP